MTLTLVKWTLHEYHRLIESEVLINKRVELLNGEIVEMPLEGEPHAYFSDESGETLTQLLGARAKVRQAKPITLPNHSEPEPDIAVVQRLGREYLSHHPYPENVFWLIEYSDTSLQKDLEVKLRCTQKLTFLSIGSLILSLRWANILPVRTTRQVVSCL